MAMAEAPLHAAHHSVHHAAPAAHAAGHGLAATWHHLPTAAKVALLGGLALVAFLIVRHMGGGGNAAGLADPVYAAGSPLGPGGSGAGLGVGGAGGGDAGGAQTGASSPAPVNLTVLPPAQPASTILLVGPDPSGATPSTTPPTATTDTTTRVTTQQRVVPQPHPVPKNQGLGSRAAVQHHNVVQSRVEAMERRLYGSAGPSHVAAVQHRPSGGAHTQPSHPAPRTPPHIHTQGAGAVHSAAPAAAAKAPAGAVHPMGSAATQHTAARTSPHVVVHHSPPPRTPAHPAAAPKAGARRV
jgi:hypothetical protein